MQYRQMVSFSRISSSSFVGFVNKAISIDDNDDIISGNHSFGNDHSIDNLMGKNYAVKSFLLFII